jgi:5-methylcytosine-specific restriction endonuclease McrA
MNKYAEKLKDPRWQRKRLEIMERDGFSCLHCGEHEKTLHVHHSYYVSGREPWDYPGFALLTLCEPCHSEVNTVKTDFETVLESIGVKSAFDLMRMVGGMKETEAV